MRGFDQNQDGVIDAAEAADVAEEIATKAAAEQEAAGGQQPDPMQEGPANVDA